VIVSAPDVPVTVRVVLVGTGPAVIANDVSVGVAAGAGDGTMRTPSVFVAELIVFGDRSSAEEAAGIVSVIWTVAGGRPAGGM